MESVSEIYELNKKQAELDFVDVIPGVDLKLYLDPYALTVRDDFFSISAHELLINYFETVLEAVRTGNRVKGINLLSHLGEPKETHLGVSKSGNSGRGVGNIQATELFNALKKSKAAESGLLEDLSDFALFIPNIGRDKISDATTNIIRKCLIDYTQTQCELHNIPMRLVPSGFYWTLNHDSWQQDYVYLPVYNNAPILLVPKFVVRYQVGVDHSRFRKMFVLEFLMAEHLRADTSLVRTIIDKKGNIKKRVFKEDFDRGFPKDKGFLESFSVEHPEIVKKYKEDLEENVSKIPDINDVNFYENDFAEFLKDELNRIPSGNDHASNYHNYCLSVISFLFFPNLVYPIKEKEINNGRKRIDILYTNGKDSGFFRRIALDPYIKANLIHVECKNYTKDIKNPEIDQLIGRFDFNRGRFGMLLFRSSSKPKKIIESCRDVARQTHGIILPIDDNFLIKCLSHVEANERKKIDRELNDLYLNIIG